MKTFPGSSQVDNMKDKDDESSERIMVWVKFGDKCILIGYTLNCKRINREQCSHFFGSISNDSSVCIL